ncbi:hypothetical protein AC578_10121 [Pseudocercospora eumusae]|uniref:BAH domain-containing protein n=1 Tax=Pseudocercospora eumusae TaxID=321146 RepID=A0A139HYR3_9PEZI|nr:hypothetical protein AC578_10121 [Pseudocercospora eumusae]
MPVKKSKPEAKKAKPAASNGARKAAPKQAPPEYRSPAQPPDLSEEDKARLWQFLDKNAAPFTVKTAAPSKKRKRDGLVQVQDDLFEDRLSVQYEVAPRDKWESLRRYKKFTVGQESIATGQCIYVKADESDDPNMNAAEQWKAKVLEVRALDSEHVYIRVAWLNRPEDLPHGRQPYHGKNELIPTNQMDVIDAMAVNGSFEVVHWDDKDEESPMPKEDDFFWRQTYDFASSGTYSELHKICVDNKPINPDQVILQCSNAKCRKWLHVNCIAEKAVKEYESVNETKKAANTPKKRGRPKNLKISPDSKASGLATNETGTVTAHIFIKGLPDGPKDIPAGSSEVVVMDGDTQEHAEDLLCLHCLEPIMDD